MPTIEELIAAIVVRLETVPDLRNYDNLPTTINPPASIVTLDQYVYDTSNGSTDVQFTVHLFTSMASDRSGLSLLYSYIDAEGDRSVKAAIDGDSTLGGLAMYAYVVDARLTPIATLADGVDYYNAKLTMQVGI